MYVIETQQLTKKFNTFIAVNDLDLKIEEGSIYGFLGPNGAGKTTTIKMLTGLIKPTSGTIKICNEPVYFGESKALKQIGFLPDVPEFYPWMTAVDFLRLSGELLGLSGTTLKNRIAELLDLVGLEANNKKIKSYSRGMKQRLGIAQALINEPKVVFLDEPTSALDPFGRKEVIEIITKLKGKVTVFFSTHILSDVERACDRVIILNKGNKIMENTIQELKKTYTLNKIAVTLQDSSETHKLLAVLENKPWIECLNQENQKIYISVTNLEEAQTAIPKYVSSLNLHLSQFITEEPTLEEVFMKVVEKA